MARRRTGIRRVGERWEVYGKVGDKQFSRRFPADTPLHLMRGWRDDRTKALREEQPKVQGSAFENHVEQFLKLEAGRRQRDFRYLLEPWVEVFQGKGSVLITSKMVQAQLDAWRVEGLAPSTLNHRRQALRSMFRRLMPDVANPTDKTKGFREPEPEPRAVPEDVLQKVFAAMPDSATKARLSVICHTGVRHSELMRVRPEDVVLGDGAQVFVRSGKGGRHRIVPLNSRGQQAFTEMARYGAWGSFSTSSMRKSWLAACRKAGVPEGAYRPYDLRHRFATRLRERGADLADVQELLGHKDIRTTRRYAPVAHAKLVTVVNALVEDDHVEPSLPARTA